MTGSTGFVGRRLVNRLRDEKVNLNVAVRRSRGGVSSRSEICRLERSGVWRWKALTLLFMPLRGCMS